MLNPVSYGTRALSFAIFLYTRAPRKRARLYYDAGLDTLDKIAKWDPEEMQHMFVEFVERTEFDGAPPTPSEAAFAVKLAKYLPRIVEY
jgi:hypothetical protein